MNDIAGLTIVILGFLVVYQWLRIRSIQEDQIRDAKYFEWYLASMDERKADKPGMELADCEDEE